MEDTNYKSYQDWPAELVSDRQTYEGLRELWHRVFGDEPEFVDHMYESFGDIEGYVIRSENGNVVSALTCYKCGTFRGKDVYVSYAVCTDPEFRGLGLAGRLTSYVRNIVTADPGVNFLMENGDFASGKGGLSIVSPATQELIGFYKGLGYLPFFFSGQGIAIPDDSGDDWDPGDNASSMNARAKVMVWDGKDGVGADWLEPGCTLTRINAALFNQYRESFLAGIPHITLSDQMTEYIRSAGPDGEGLFLINKGDAICAVETSGQEADGSDEEGKALHAYAELLVNPRLKDFSSEIEEELASALAEALGVDKLFYRMPGKAYCQSMIAGQIPADEADTQAYAQDDGADDPSGEFSDAALPYFGFPID